MGNHSLTKEINVKIDCSDKREQSMIYVFKKLSQAEQQLQHRARRKVIYHRGHKTETGVRKTSRREY